MWKGIPVTQHSLLVWDSLLHSPQIRASSTPTFLPEVSKTVMKPRITDYAPEK